MSKEFQYRVMGKSQCVKLLLGAWLVVLSAGWAGCLKSNPNPSALSANYSTYIVLMNMAPYSPATDVYLNDVKSTPAIPAGTFSSSYAHLTPAVYDVKFKVAGGDSLLSEIPAAHYDSMKFYTLILYNDSIKGPAKSVKIIDNYNVVTVGSAWYRFIHMCPELPAVDVYLNGSIVQQNRKSSDILSYGSNTVFQSLPPSSYSLQLKKAGTDSVIYSSASLTLLAGNAYTLFLSGSATNAADPISVGLLKASY